jgi:SET domain-containing protein
LPSHLEQLVSNQNWKAIEVKSGLSEGRGVFATEVIQKGADVCNYGGRNLTFENAEKLMYNTQTSTYLLECVANGQKCFFNHDHSGAFAIGKFINHSKKHPVLSHKVYLKKNGHPEVIFLAKKRIQIGQELTYNYGTKYSALPDCVSSCNLCKKK